MTIDTLLPLAFVLALPALLPHDWRFQAARRKVWERVLVALLAVIVLRYLWWRFSVTVLPVRDPDIQSVFIWTLFVIELISWIDAAILFMALLRRTDRSPEADAHERRLRLTATSELPHVDVFIATYNEPLDVLEKTIIGAVSLDWPRERLHVYVLDDGRRDWLRDLCARTGAIHMTRADNAHAKAGNINAAIKRTDSPFFLVLDADFVPQRGFLYRAIGFFDDPSIGIVQIPHNFFNGDPMQSNLGLRRTLPDDQRLFFDAIMPGRDGWDCAFCCGSNALTRRSAMMAVGGGLPTGSITEDMLLTLALLRKGFVTRYLNERLAVGLAAESLAAFFVQRARWAQGAIQILYLREGPLGPGLRLHQRLMFLPTHWLTQSLSQIAAMTTPAIYLLTGLMPLVGATVPSVLSYQVPAVLATLVILRMLAPGQFFPLASAAHGVLQAFRLLPTVLWTLVKPHGHAFKVTPKGSDAAGGVAADRFTLRMALGLVTLTALGLMLNANFNTQIIATGALIPVVAFWALYNMFVLSVVAAIAVSPPMLRTEERFPFDEVCRLRTPDTVWSGQIRDISLSGVLVVPDPDYPGQLPRARDWIVIDIARVGPVGARVTRLAVEGFGAEFSQLAEPSRHALIRRLYTEGIDNSTHTQNGLEVGLHLLLTVLKRAGRPALATRATATPPEWVVAMTEVTAATPETGWPTVVQTLEHGRVLKATIG